MNFNRIIIVLLFLKCVISFGQNFNIEQVGKSKLINVSGGASASSIFYSGSATRDPFNYFLNGNINLNIAGLYNLPFSFSYTNQKLGYGKPVLMNRLSIHPSYKWITAHIGDASMSFSPYTLSGHQFTGFGVDLTPQGKFKISAMYGRLLRSNEYNSNLPDLLPTYKRFGYGFKTQYALEKVNIGVTFFKAKDQVNSINPLFPFELGVTPKENTAISLETAFKLLQKVQITTEVATSSVTEDIREKTRATRKINASLFLNPNSTTAHYNAFRGQLAYPAGNGTLGLGYERIDPNYRTLGGYFFNNDLENITVNATQTVLKNKVNLAMNFGLQKDNLDKQKQSQMKRLVSSVTADVKVNQKLNVNANYSNFQSFTNSRNQFDFINQTSNFENLDTLNFRQVNKSASLSVNYLLKNTKKIKHTFNANFSMQDAINQQQGKTIAGGATTYYNNAISYLVGLPQRALNLTASVNNTLGITDTGRSLILGPTLAANKLFFDKKLNTSAAISYNTSSNNGMKQNDVFNFRLNGSYIYKEKHNFSFNAISLFNNTKTAQNKDITATLSYSYSFDKIKLRPTKTAETKEQKDSISAKPAIRILYKGQTYQGNRAEILNQLDASQFNTALLSQPDQSNLKQLFSAINQATDDKEFKNKVLDYLIAQDSSTKNIVKYEEYLVQAYTKLEKDMKNKDESLENEYLSLVGRINMHPFHDKKEEEISNKNGYKSYVSLLKKSEQNKNKLVRHRWMYNEISLAAKMQANAIQENKYVSAFSAQIIDNTLELVKNKKTSEEIISAIEMKLIPFYHDLASKNTSSDDVNIKYLQK